MKEGGRGRRLLLISLGILIAPAIWWSSPGMRVHGFAALLKLSPSAWHGAIMRRFGDHEAAGLVVCAEAFQSGSQEARDLGVDYCVRLGPAAVPGLIRLLSSDNRDLSHQARRALDRVHQTAPEETWRGRVRASEWLALMGELRSLLKGRGRERLRAIWVLRHLGELGEAAVPDLVALLKPGRRVAVEAAQTLLMIRPRGERAFVDFYQGSGLSDRRWLLRSLLHERDVTRASLGTWKALFDGEKDEGCRRFLIDFIGREGAKGAALLRQVRADCSAANRQRIGELLGE